MAACDRDRVKMTPAILATIRALSLHWSQVEIAACIGCAASTVGEIQRVHAMPRMSQSDIQLRANWLWWRMWRGAPRPRRERTA